MANGCGAVADGLNPDRAFWKGKRVFLTGHSGFKGTWLTLWLHQLGAEVMGFSLPTTQERYLGQEAQLETIIQTKQGDICDVDQLVGAVRDFAPEVVLHLAAQSLVQRSYKQPRLTFETNVIGTINLMEALRETPSVRAAVIVTTDKCYENREWPWPYRENDRLGGGDPYSASKACAELAVAAWRRSFFQNTVQPVAIATARAGNVIGGGDWAPDRLVPDCIRALTAKQIIQIRNPRATRPWQHVLEPLCGYLMLAERLFRRGSEFAGAWNFGPRIDDVQPVAALADQVVALWGDGAAWTPVPHDSPHEAALLALDSAKARNEIGWRPRLTLSKALAWSVDWYKAHQDGGDAVQLIHQDIAAYEQVETAGD